MGILVVEGVHEGVMTAMVEGREGVVVAVKGKGEEEVVMGVEDEERWQ